jgi:nicotinate (nicotinamide) nucleotide adenylyltransferase
VKKVIVIPSANPPHKVCRAGTEDRVAMTRLSFQEDARYFGGTVEVDLREIERATRTTRASYTFDTLLDLGRQIPKIAFVLGADQLQEMPKTWHRFPEVLELAHWIVLARRPGGDVTARQSLQQWEASGLVRPVSDYEWCTKAGTFLGLFETEAPGLSSTAIRETIARTGQVPEGSLFSTVEEYLKEKSLYGSHRHD